MLIEKYLIPKAKKLTPDPAFDKAFADFEWDKKIKDALKKRFIKLCKKGGTMDVDKFTTACKDMKTIG